MDTIHPLLSHLTDTKTTIDTINAMLRQTDRNFPAEERSFTEGIQAIRAAAGDAAAEELLHAVEEQLAAELIFLFWNGIRLNAACFRDPIRKSFLQEDHEVIHQEHLLQTLPTVRHQAADILRQLPPDLSDPIISYRCYLETYGYKLAHFLGFRIADDFLPWILPGYISDPALTLRYKMDLEQYLSAS